VPNKNKRDVNKLSKIGVLTSEKSFWKVNHYGFTNITSKNTLCKCKKSASVVTKLEPVKIHHLA
jgi:regulation of enolase protein 1 (concanavalin A-like superfamily)